MITGHQLGRACREPGFSPPPPDPDPPIYLILPTTLAQAAVRMHHKQGAAAAKQYLARSKVGDWANHQRPSMATNNQRVLDGFDWYVQEDAADGRPMKDLDRDAVVSLHGINVDATIDVALGDGSGVAGRVVLWDGPDFDALLAPTIACVFAHALQAIFPSQNYTTIGIWQARRQYREEVPFASALGSTAAAHKVLAAM